MASEYQYGEVDSWLDGEGPMPAGYESDPDLKMYAEAMRAVRASVRDNALPEIGDAQFRVFMDGVREGMAPQPRLQRSRWWPLFSLAAASFLISLSVFYIFWGDPVAVRATDVEEVSTELDGATMDWYDNDDGVTTIWVNYSGDDL